MAAFFAKMERQRTQLDITVTDNVDYMERELKVMAQDPALADQFAAIAKWYAKRLEAANANPQVVSRFKEEFGLVDHSKTQK